MAFIECCRSNLPPDGRKELISSPHRVRETICLDRCGTCYDDPFVVVDGELHTGTSHRDILRSLDQDSEESEE